MLRDTPVGGYGTPFRRSETVQVPGGTTHVHSAGGHNRKAKEKKGSRMERFIRRENIKRYRKLLLETKDDAERRLIQRLLTAEEQKEPPESSLPMLPANAMSQDPRAGLFTVRQRFVRWCQAHALTSELWSGR